MSRLRQPHTAAPRGKKIHVVLKNGTAFVDRFRERHGTRIIFDQHEVKKGDVRRFMIVRTRPGVGRRSMDGTQ